MAYLQGRKKTAMIYHTGIGDADIDRSAAIYDAALGALGMQRAAQLPDDAGIGGIGYGYDDHPFFFMDRYHPHSVRQYTAFVARSRDEVDAFHAAMEEGGGPLNGGRRDFSPPTRGAAPDAHEQRRVGVHEEFAFGVIATLGSSGAA
jgi:hypothetical protein